VTGFEPANICIITLVNKAFFDFYDKIHDKYFINFML
jgi:hypothetical protein